MAKLSLTPNPTFPAKVGIPVAGDAKPVDVLFTFKHMKREALEKWLKTLDGKDKVVALQEMAAGWELTDEFNADSIRELFEGYMGAFNAILAKYLNELSGNREKN